MSEYSIYPKAIDGYAQIPLAVDKKSPVNAESVNRLRSGIVNTEKTLGVSPHFSHKFGEFPDVARRIDHLEGFSFDLKEEIEYIPSLVQTEVASVLGDIESLLDASELDITLTSLYLKESEFNISEGPLSFLAGEDESMLRFLSKNDDVCSITFGENLDFSSSSGVSFAINGTLPNVLPGIGELPKSVVIKRSVETSPNPGFTQHSYLSFGGELQYSDLCFARSKELGASRPTLGLIANSGAMFGELTGGGGDHHDLEIMTTQSFSANSPGSITLSAGDAHAAATDAGDISIKTGSSAYGDGASANFGGGTGAGGGPISLVAGRHFAGHANGAHLFLTEGISGSPGTAALAGGDSPTSSSNGGPVRILGGEGDVGGNVWVESGESKGAGAGTSSVNIAADNGSGNLLLQGQIKMIGTWCLDFANWSASIDGSPVLLGNVNCQVLYLEPDIVGTQVTLPDAATCIGKVYTIKGLPGNYPVTIEDAAGKQIDGALNAQLAAPYDHITVQSTGNQWFKIG